VENSPRRYYGIPGNDHRGFKIADDTPKEPFDPSHGDRTPSAEGIEDIRRYLSYRFPALKRAPLLETRVCQYEMTPDGNFILDRHPRAQNVWFMGGGSGHGFKVAPAAGELAADLVTGARSVPGLFQLARFSEADRLVTTRPRA
jgi:glycine/D-amino acid oxidase-like deaminating enzyme